MALGAFFAGMVVKESDFSHRAEEETLPLREIFSILFFVSVGMLFDPHILIERPLHILAVIAIIMVGKTLAAMALVLFFRYPINTALTVGASLAQIGEFSYFGNTWCVFRSINARSSKPDFSRRFVLYYA